MPSRQQCLSSLIFCVTAPTASVFYRRMCGCGALKKDVCTAKATVRRPVVSSRHLYAWSFETRLLRQLCSWERSGRLLVSIFGCTDTRLKRSSKGHMSVDG